MVDRSVALGLGVICIVLVAGLGGVIALYTFAISDRDNTIAGKNNQIASLNAQTSQLSSNLTNLQNQVASDNNTITDLTNQVNQLTYMLTHESLVLFSNNSMYIFTGKWGIPVLWNYTFTKAGCVCVWVNQSTNIYVNFEYSSNGTKYDSDQTGVGTGGITVFPISATTNLNIIVGTFDDSMPTLAITVTYYY